MLPLSRLGCPMSLKTPNMGNPGSTLEFTYAGSLTTPMEPAVYNEFAVQNDFPTFVTLYWPTPSPMQVATVWVPFVVLTAVIGGIDDFATGLVRAALHFR